MANSLGVRVPKQLSGGAKAPAGEAPAGRSIFAGLGGWGKGKKEKDEPAGNATEMSCAVDDTPGVITRRRAAAATTAEASS